MQLWEGFRNDLLSRLEMAIRIVVTHWREQKKDKAKKQEFIDTLM